MIHYHGAPCGGSAEEAAKFYVGRHAMISFAYLDHLPMIAEFAQSFVIDNGAFTTWRSGRQFDHDGYLELIERMECHPCFDWCLIPDEIDGDQKANDALISDWPFPAVISVPVWHLHESLNRLRFLAAEFPRVALGSSGQWATPGTQGWWHRIAQAMDAICDEAGRPLCKLHGLRMLDTEIFRFMPLASADSTNAAVNQGSLKRFGMYTPPTASQRAQVIANRIEAVNSAPIWARHFIPNGDLLAINE